MSGIATCKARLDKSVVHRHFVVMIGSIRHKALRNYWTRGQAKGLNAEWIRKLRRILSALDAAERAEHMNYPGIVLPSPEGGPDGPLRGSADGQLPGDLRLG